MPENPVYAVILAGGQGTRLWPISRKARPKQFLDLAGSGHSLLQETVQRSLEFTGSLQFVLVLTQADFGGLVREQLPGLPPENVICEPVGRNTAASLALTAVHLSNLQTSSDAIMVTLPVDHLFADEKPWFLAVHTAIAAAAQTDALVAIGLAPEFPATGFGYQQLGGRLDLDLPLPVHAIRKFIEKPDATLAQSFIKSGEYLWNTGTYTWKVSAFLAALQKHTPGLLKELRKLGHPIDPLALGQIYPGFPSVSVDTAILEKEPDALTVKADFVRIDVGALDSLAEVWSVDSNGNSILGQLLSHNSHGNIMFSDQGIVALIDVQDLIVIRSGDVVLVCPRGKAQELKELVADLPKRGLERFL
jgi:mannose-1-phosphate guanylyltransferase